MGSIPPIALDIRPPQQIAGPLDLYQQRMSVQTLINQDKLQKQAMQQNETEQQQQQLKLQQEQEMEADKQKFNQVFHDAGGDWDAAISGASKSGVSAQFISNAQKMRTDQISKLATATKDQLENHAKQNEEIGVSAQKVLGAADEGASPEDLQALYSQERNAHILSGGFKPQDIPEKMPPIDQLRTIAASSKAARDMVTAAQDLQDKKAKAATEALKSGQDELGFVGQTLSGVTDPNQLPERLDFLERHGVSKDTIAQFENITFPDAIAKAKSMAAASISPEKRAQFQNSQSDEKGFINDYIAQNNLPDSPASRNQARKTYAAMKPNIVAAISAGQAGAAPPAASAGKTGADFLATLKPAQASVIKFYGDGNGDISTFMSRMKPNEKANFIANVTAYKPDFNQSTFGTEKAMQRYMTSGEGGKNLTAFNTAIEHAQQLNSAIDKLGNINEHTYNKLGNALNVEIGQNPVTNFNVIKNALAGEISKVFKGGQATDAEIKAVEEPFSSANSPAQLKGAVQQAINLMNSKRDALKSQYEAGKKGQPNFGEAKTIDVKAPNGKTYHFSDQAAADAFKQKAGIQ